MFKSIFSKYIMAFALLIGGGFTIISLIVSSMVITYSIDTKNNLMYQTAEITYTTVNGLMQDFKSSYRDTLTTYSNFLEQSLGKLSLLSDSVILLTTQDGDILLTIGEDANTVKSNRIPRDVMSELLANSNSYLYRKLGNVFDERTVNYVYFITDKGSPVGAIFICSSSTGLTGMVEQMTKTIVLSSIWIFIAALIAVYFITEKISEPLKIMSKAAQEFSMGKFDTRIPVKGTGEVASLAEAFNDMASSLAKLEETRRAFVGNVSHDLRTPMTSIAGFIDGILDGAIPPEKHEHYLRLVSAEVRRLSRLVNSLLDITRMEAGEKKFNMQPFDVCETARLVLISFEEKINAKKLNVDFECTDDKSMVIGDSDAIHQVIYNLCDNAIKFTPENGDLKVSIIKKERKYRVSVYNTGEGIDSEDLPFVFDRFYKTDRSRGLDKTGAGLGLFIVKTLIDAHGERISVRSEKGRFCEFYFKLPIANIPKNVIGKGVEKNIKRTGGK